MNKEEGLLVEFEQLQGLIEIGVDEDALGDQMSERETFQNKYFTLLSKAKTFFLENSLPEGEGDNNLDKDSVTSRSHSGNAVAVRPKIHVKLLQIILPSFNGSYDTWLEFRDTYTSLVHSRPDLDNIEKYHYMRAHLTGDAKQVIQSIEFSADNYLVAWDLLCERYNNKQLLVYNHLKQLFDIPASNSESASDLRNIYDNIAKHLRALKVLELPVEHWNTLIIFFLTNKLDKKSERQWEAYKKSESPTLDEFKAFIKEKADVLEKLELKYEKEKYKSVNKSTSKPKTQRAFLTTNQAKCMMCKGDHYITNCNKFLSLSTNNRIQQCKIQKLFELP